SYDTVDYESIDKIEFWVVEDEPTGELDYEELEAEFEELLVDDDDVECSNSQQVEAIWFEEFSGLPTNIEAFGIIKIKNQT
ncbi:hypothetical protein ACH5RR_008978, partial [Cinchona calisaya]